MLSETKTLWGGGQLIGGGNRETGKSYTYTTYFKLGQKFQPRMSLTNCFENFAHLNVLSGLGGQVAQTKTINTGTRVVKGP